MINERIRDHEVRLLDENGDQLGIMSSQQALRIADERQLDLVKIAPQGKPPVCKLMDYGKYRFEASRHEREVRKNQKVITIKEVRLSATIEDHDLAVKAKDAQRLLREGDKVKVSIRFRGRQVAHSELGLKVMEKFAASVGSYATVERRPITEGRNMTMMLAPTDESKWAEEQQAEQTLKPEKQPANEAKEKKPPAPKKRKKDEDFIPENMI